MREYQTRVVEEKAEIDEKIQKLDSFLRADTSVGLPERFRMARQNTAMQEYSRILQERISTFSGENDE